MKKFFFLIATVITLGLALFSDLVPVSKANQVNARDCYYPEVGTGWCTTGSYVICYTTSQYCFAFNP